MRPSSIALLLVGGIAFSSCGYGFQGGGSILPPDIKTVAIPLAENDTTEPALGQRFTEALRSRFDRYGAVKVVESAEGADAILEAKVVDLDNKVRGVTSDTDIQTESDLVLVVSAELRKRSGQLLYRTNNLQITDSVASVTDTVVTSSSDFAQSGIGSGALNSLGSRSGDREVARGQEEQVIDTLLDEASRKIYLEAVAADF